MRPYCAIQSLLSRRRIPFLLLAAFVSACATPAVASPISVLSYDGTYTVSYDTTQQSLPINSITTFPGTARVNLGAHLQGVIDPNGTTDGILSTLFTIQLNLQFQPTAGSAFTGLVPIELPGQVGFHHGYYGGEVFDETTTVTSLSNSSVQALHGPYLSNIPGWGQGGGGAYNLGIPFGTIVPPTGGFTSVEWVVASPGGFEASVLMTVLLYDNSSFEVGAIDFGVHTVAAAAVVTPLPAALPLFATGLAGLGWLARRRRKQAS